MELKVTQGGAEVAPPPEWVQARQVTVGADLKADWTLEDEALAPLQVRFTRRGELWWLYDLDPARGVQLNGAAVPAGHLVQDQDTLELGSHELRVELDAAERGAAGALRGSVDPGLEAAGQAYLRLETGEVFSLARDSFLIGKDEGADLQLSGWNAPAQAVVIVRGQEGHHLLNLSGDTKVFHQSKPVGLQVALKDCDRLEIRGLYAIFHSGEVPRG